MTDSKVTDRKFETTDANSQHYFPLNIRWHDRRLGSIDLTRQIPKHNAVVEDTFFERLKGVE